MEWILKNGWLTWGIQKTHIRVSAITSVQLSGSGNRTQLIIHTVPFNFSLWFDSDEEVNLDGLMGKLAE